ncbi:hypothetical protein JYT72_02250, partial [Crocinitomix catalasitica]|nr:hypothetical protein [Crocinitomix catalasitica]
MEEWWAAMSQLEHVYWIIALISSILFLVVLVGTFLGGGAETDMDAVDVDMDADVGIGFQFLTFKNIVGFFTVFSWAGIAAIKNGESNTFVLIVSSIAGLVMLFLLAAMFRWMSKQAESGTLRIDNALGKVGEVYTTIGKNRESSGKIQIKVQGALRELDALTDE